MAIEINKEKLNDNYGSKAHADAVAILNGIYDYIANGGYVEGCRNNIAVDTVCCEHVLGMDPGDSVWDLLDYSQKDDFKDRALRIIEYLWSWDREFNGVFDKMFTTPDDWKEVPEHFVIA